MKTIKTSDIKVSFDGENDPPKDEVLIYLLKKAYRGELLCHKAIIDWEGIKPFSDYRPKITQDFENHFLSSIKNEKHPPLYVYQDGDKFIMSDDYNLYYFYKEVGCSNVPCLIIGEIKEKSGIVKIIDKPFYLEPPTAVKVVGDKI